MKLNEVNEALDHKITSGSEYQWNCYPDARYLDYESDFANASVIYSTDDQTIYQAEISVKREAWDEDKKPYRWLNPDYKDAAASYIDLGFASRGFKDTEAGVDGTFGQICWDAVVAVVNEANSAITNITTDQLKNAYDKNGNIANWQDLT